MLEKPSPNILQQKETIRSFLDTYTAEEIHAALWHWFSCTISGSFENLNSAGKENMAVFYKELSDFMDAFNGLGLETAQQVKGELIHE